jgi:hypothetical protein
MSAKPFVACSIDAPDISPRETWAAEEARLVARLEVTV